MSNSTKLIVVLITLVALIALWVFVLKPDTVKPEVDPSIAATQTPNENQKEESETEATSVNSISEAWVWPEGEGVKTLSAKDMRELQFGDKPYSLHSIYAALESVRIDENGDIILDHTALLALNEALERYYNQIDPRSLREIEQIIKDALPGKLGEQTAQLVRDYHGFLGAQAEFNQMHQYVSGPQNLSEVERDRSLYSDLHSLREAHLGTDTAERLFSQTNAGAEFMFDMMSLDMDTSLSAQERELRRAEIQSRFNQEMYENDDDPEDSDQGS